MLAPLPSPAPDKQLCLRLLTMPENTNPSGIIFGGWIMAQTDIAGATLAVTAARSRVSTVAVRDFEFLAPIQVGDYVNFYGNIIRTGRSSMTVHVQAFVQRLPCIEHYQLVAQATLIYVPVGADGKSRPLPEKYQHFEAP